MTTQLVNRAVYSTICENEMVIKMRASMHWHYFQICRDHLKVYENTEIEIEKYRGSDQEKHIIEMNVSAAYSKRERAVVISIIFAAMCLEAFIYDYGAKQLSGSFVRDHIDKLEISSKLVLLTELVTGKRFPTDSQAYEGLKKLVRDRNRLVHFKSKEFKSNELQKLEKWHEDMNKELRKAMYNAYETVIAVMKELDILHNNKTNYYQKYITDAECYA